MVSQYNLKNKIIQNSKIHFNITCSKIPKQNIAKPSHQITIKLCEILIIRYF